MAAFDIAFDFRATSGFVTDPSYATYCIGEAYPTTRTINGYSVTFGWESGTGLLTRDGSAALDPRLAGINFGGTGSVFRVDLPDKGDVLVGLAVGDPRNNPNTTTITVSDTVTNLISFTAIQTVNTVADATNTLWGVAAWPGSNISVTKTFTTTICRVSINTLGGLVHIRFTGNTASTLRNLPLLGAG